MTIDSIDKAHGSVTLTISVHELACIEYAAGLVSQHKSVTGDDKTTLDTVSKSLFAVYCEQMLG